MTAPTTHASTPATSNFSSRAVPLIDRGFSVIPLTPNDKAPVLGIGALSRSNSREIVAGWAVAYPNANVGICSDDNFTLLETDDEKMFREKVRATTGNELPKTLKLGSGRENRGCWIFKRTDKCGTDCLEVPGVFEFRNRNQYVAAPGSIHPNGSEYRWLEDAPIIPMPDWLVVALIELDGGYKGTASSEHVKTGPANALKDAYGYHCDPEDMFGLDLEIASNERHYALLSVAGFLHDGRRDREDILDILKRVRDEYCQSPEDKGDAELERIADHVMKGEPCEIEPYDLPSYAVGLTVFDNAEHMAEWVAQNIDTLEIKSRPEQKSGGLLIDYDTFIAEKIEPRKVLLSDSETGGAILYASSLNQLFAYRGIGKTVIEQILVRLLTNGGKELKFESTGGNKVILVDGELPATQLQERCKAFIGEKNENIRLVTRERSGWFPKLAVVEEQKRFISEIETFGANVIVFDTLSSIFRMDTNDWNAWDTVNEFLTELRSAGYCVLLINHAGKNLTVRGRSDGDDRLDVSIRLDAPKGWEPGCGALHFDLSYDKVRHGARLTPFSAKLVGGLWLVDGRTKDASLVAVKAGLTAGKTQRQIAKETGLGLGTVNRIVRSL